MTQTSNKPSGEQLPFLPGAYLKAAREERGVPREYLRHQLGLTRTLFDALEADDADRLPGAFYVRAYLRRYAEVLGLRVAPVLAGYQTFLESTGRVEVAPVEEPNPRPVKVMIASALALLLGTSLVFGAIVTDSDSDTATPAAEETLAVEAPIRAPEPAEIPAENRLDLSFSTDSWVEVVDARDHILAVSLQREGTSLSLEGVPPFAVTLGYGPGVDISYLDSPVTFDVDSETFAAKVVIGK